MQLVVLGSGTSVPHPERAAAAHWLQAKGGSLLLDISPAAIHRMAQERLDWVNLDAIWVSHFHLDHVGGLAPFLFGTKHAPQTHARRCLRFFGALLRRAARAHLAARHVEHTRAIALRFQLQERTRHR